MAKLAYRGGRPVRRTPFAPWPEFDKREERYLLKTLRSRNWGGFPSPNERAAEFAAKFAAAHNAKYGVCAANGTVTLEMALKAGGLVAGDEVITTPYTWVATAAAPVTVNMVPVFVDVDPDTYCLDPELIEAAITPRTRAVICVHLGSTICDLDALKRIAKKYSLVLIEDCAHAHGGAWKGKGVGAHGDFGSFSFQSSKLMTAGEGGLVTTNTKHYEMLLQSLVNCGRKDPGYDRYSGRVLGWNYRLSDLQAAVLLAQLARLPKVTAKRQRNALYLTKQLDKIAGITTLKRDQRITTSPHYQYIFKYDPAGFKGLHRDDFLTALAAEGVELDGDFYVPVYENPLFAVTALDWPMIKKRYGDAIPGSRKLPKCPVSTRAAYHEACWLHYPALMGTRADVDDVVAAIRKVQEHVDEILPRTRDGKPHLPKSGGLRARAAAKQKSKKPGKKKKK